MTQNKPFNILYLVHDLSDAGVLRRVEMLRDGGAHIVVAGFRRSEKIPDHIAGARVIDLGLTYNGSFLQRIKMVLLTIMKIARHKALFEDADLVLARNLEMLAIGVRGASSVSNSSKPAIIYESLDIHRLLIREDFIGRTLRALEGWLGNKACALITSSPAFITQYFEKRSKLRRPIRLVENKVYGVEQNIAEIPRPPAPPWRIGWFGALRCAKSLKILADLAQNNNGAIEVIIRGRPAYDQMPDFDHIVANTPHLTYGGVYKYPDDLQKIYGDIHFTWAIDMFEEGLNSSWLLPNRLYEGGMYASIPLVQSDVETGRYAGKLNIGVSLKAPLEHSVTSFFQSLTPKDYALLLEKSQSIPLSQWVCSIEDSKNLVLWLKELSDKNAKT